MMVRRSTVAAAAALALLLAGCATPDLKTPADYPRLTVDPNDENTLVFTKPDLQLGSYRRVFFDPVRMRVNDDGKESEVTGPEAAEIAQYMQKSFSEQFAKSFEVVPAPGPGVLRIRLTVTDLKPTSKAQMAMMLPPFSVINMVSPKGAFLGSITLGGEIFEGTSAQPSVAFIANRSRPGIDATVAFSRWAVARKVIDNAAERMARDLAGLRKAP